MSNDLMEKMAKVFKTPEQFSLENIEGLVHETLKFFSELKTKLESPNEKVREEAMNTAMALKTQLEEQALALCDSIGMDPQSLEKFINTSANFSSEEWQIMEKAKNELAGYQNEIAAKGNLSSQSTPKKKRSPAKEWLVS